MSSAGTKDLDMGWIVDIKRLMTGLVGVGVVALVGFFVANWNLSSKVDKLSEDVEHLATHQDVETAEARAIGSAKAYTDSKIHVMEGQVVPKLERIITIQESIQEDVRDARDDRKTQRKDLEDIRQELGRVKMAVEDK